MQETLIPILPKRELLLLGRQMKDIDGILRWPDRIFYGVVDDISLWSPAQQVYHLIIVNLRCFDVINALYDDEDEKIAREGGISATGRWVMLTGIIPRGKGQAPPETEPPADVLREDALRAFAESKRALGRVAGRAPYLHSLTGRWPHPVFGHLTAPQWLKFARLHTRHHVRLAQDIRQAGQHSAPDS